MNISVLAACAFAAILSAAAATAGDRQLQLSDFFGQLRKLCTNGHPAHRPPDVTYAHLLPRPGMQRDHIIPLCLGGSDTLDNLQYQPWPQARIKDEAERRACEAYCAGLITLDEARARFH
jgi:hypothetical protein